MDPKEIAALTGLELDQARLARHREYSEPFIVEAAPSGAMQQFLEGVQATGLQYTRGGRFHHLMGPTDKGKAVRLLAGVIQGVLGEGSRTVALGDSPNDFDMLMAVDIAILVQRPDGSYADTPVTLACYRAPEIGPRGWAKAMAILLKSGSLPAAWLHGCHCGSPT